jgi:hypothetical protein
MRNHILPIAIAFVVAAPCTAFAGEKKTIEVNSFSFGATNSGSGISSGGGAAGLARTKFSTSTLVELNTKTYRRNLKRRRLASHSTLRSIQRCKGMFLKKAHRGR